MSTPEQLFARRSSHPDQLDGMLHLPLIRYVEVRETYVTSPFKVSRGSVQVKDAVVREFPIYYCDNDRHQIGVLHVEGSLTDIYRICCARRWPRSIHSGVARRLCRARPRLSSHFP
ncbi:hypothetical protein [Caballeronia sordidicola]|uniref:hypothetical protein n=1 Tax=Caballeronia sordidicola TaxID=196367 RepID=UPI003AF32AA0